MNRGLFLIFAINLAINISLIAGNESHIVELEKYLDGRTLLEEKVFYPKVDISGKDLSDVTLPDYTQLPFADGRGLDFRGSTSRHTNFQGADFSPLEQIVKDKKDKENIVPKLRLDELPKPIFTGGGAFKKVPLKPKAKETFLDRIELQLEDSKPFFDPRKPQLGRRSSVVVKRTNLEGADFERCNFVGANFYQANAKYANLKGAKLRGANLRDADFEGANFENAILDNAQINDKTSFVGVKGLSPEMKQILKDLGAKI